MLVVHGTYANPQHEPRVSGERLWWQSTGAFTRALDNALARHGSEATCNPHSLWLLRRDEIDTSWLGWSGENSEVERRRGAFQLAAHIRSLQAQREIRRIHLVAHSHGGNVARRAMRYLNDPGYKLGIVVCLGTPFLHFGDTAAWRRWMARVHWPMLALAAGIGAALWLWALPRADSANVVVVALLTAVAVAALFLMWEYARTSEASSRDVGAIGVRFANDEAVQLLRSCAALAAEPHIYLRDLLGGPAPTRARRAAERKPQPMDWFDRVWHAASEIGRVFNNTVATLSNAWNGPICRAAERVTSACYRSAALGSVCALLLILTFRPYRPPLRPFVFSRMPRLGALFFHSMEEESQAQYRQIVRGGASDAMSGAWKGLPIDPETLRTLAAFLAMLLYPVLYPIDKLLGLFSWFGAVMTRFAILLGARAAAGSAPGMDMLGAAFQGARTGLAPESVTEVIVPEAIEQDIEQRLGATSRVDFAALRASLDPARRASLPNAIKALFTDVGLLHAQYYQDPRIIDYIAQRIAGTPAPEWVLDATASSAAPATPPVGVPGAKDASD